MGASRIRSRRTKTGLHRRDLLFQELPRGVPSAPPISELAPGHSVKICKSCRCVTAFEFATSCCSSSWFLDIASFVLRETRSAPRHVKLASAAPCPLLCQCVDVTLRSLHMLHMRRRDGDVARSRKSLLRLPKGVRRKKRICLPIIANIKKQSCAWCC